MNKGNTKQFINKNRLEDMIKLRRRGFAESTLALMYRVDKSTIRYHLKKYYITHPPVVYTVERIIAKTLPPPVFASNWKVVGNERINMGKSYAEYIIPLVEQRRFSKN